MATNLIAEGTTEANSADFDLTAGQKANIFLISGTQAELGVVTAYLQIKSPAGAYVNVGTFSQNFAGGYAEGPGTYRVYRPASSIPFGICRA